jgi:hypothetical protein
VIEFYTRIGTGDLLTQGDIILDCPVFRTDDLGNPVQHLERVVVMTQACDLANIKTELVVVAIVYDVEMQVKSGVFKPQQIRDQIRTGRTFGLYFLPAGPDPKTMPESIVDLRDLHTISRKTLESLIAANKRPVRLVTPFREHLAQHFAVTYMRIALPDPYPTSP